MTATLMCGHPRELEIKSVESSHRFCELCEERSQRRDAEKRESELQALVTELRKDAAEFCGQRNEIADESERCHEILDSALGIGGDGTTSIETLEDRLSAFAVRHNGVMIQLRGAVARITELTRDWTDAMAKYDRACVHRDALATLLRRLANGHFCAPNEVASALAAIHGDAK